MERLLAILTLTVALLGCRADIPEHFIESLPGWSGPLPSRQYSGYINVSATKHMHYW